MVQDNVILWIDLETTGTGPDAEVVEFGAVLTDASPEFKELSTFTATLKPTVEYDSPVVIEMHKKSGLTEDLKNPTYLLPSSLEQEVLHWINDTVGFSTEHIPWGGSGVGHFDARFIKKYFPYLSKRLTYWVYDVGVLRRMLKLININFATGESKTHRALEDAQLHVEEARVYLDYINTLKNEVSNVNAP